MELKTVQRIDGIRRNEILPTMTSPQDFYNVIAMKGRELRDLCQTSNKPAIEKCCAEIAALTVEFLESGLVSP